MSKLLDKITLMKSMDDDELRLYINTLTENEKNTIIFSAIRTLAEEQQP